MKKIWIWGVIALLLVAIIPIKHTKLSISRKEYWIRNKDFGEGGWLSSYIQINPDIDTVAKQLKSDSEQQSIINAYNWLESNYHYVTDNNISFSDGTITIHEHSDYWQSPLLTLAIIKKTGGFYGDCEDGAFLLTSILNAMGYKDVYCEIGTVTLQSGIYGHAWVVWKNNLLETTRGIPLDYFRKLPAFYSPQFKFNYWETYEFYGGSMKQYPLLDSKARKELLQKLQGG